MGCRRTISKASLVAILFVGFIWFLFVGILGKQVTKTSSNSIAVSSNGSFKLLKLIGTERLSVHQKFDLNYVSKRRVPNGPDPLHNRRAGKYRQPPDRA